MLDWSRIEELREEVGEDAFGEVVDLFLDEVSDTLGQLDSHDTPAAMEEAMHFLKGASLNLGFSALSELCAKGETDARAGALAAVDVGAVRQCYQATAEAFKAEVTAKGYWAA
ncbi:MAG: Hpt domain-containing protein [Pseudomonadota bacterium]